MECLELLKEYKRNNSRENFDSLYVFNLIFPRILRSRKTLIYSFYSVFMTFPKGYVPPNKKAADEKAKQLADEKAKQLADEKAKQLQMRRPNNCR